MTRLRRFLGALFVLMGGIWFFQGLGVIRSRSFMTDEPLWILIGAAVALAGVALMVLPRPRP